MANSNGPPDNGGPSKRQRNQPLMDIAPVNFDRRYNDPIQLATFTWPNNYPPNYQSGYNFNPGPNYHTQTNYGNQFGPPNQPTTQTSPPGHTYRGKHYNPNFSKKNSNEHPQTGQPRQPPTSSTAPVPLRVDYYAKLKQCRKTATCDGSDFLNGAGVPVSEDWSKFMEPYFSLAAHRMLSIAAKALKAAEKQAKVVQPPLLSEEEFNAKLDEVTKLHKL